MKRLLFTLCLVVLLPVWAAGCAGAVATETLPTPIPPTPTPTIVDIASQLQWFGLSAILYQGSKIIYFDPVSLPDGLPKADIILITYGHNDRWSVTSLVKIIGPETRLIIGPNVTKAYDAAQDTLGIPATVLEEGRSIEVDGVGIEAVPAYDSHLHPKGSGGVGYIVSIDGLRIYHAGGTAAFPEMADYACDIALLPLHTLDLLKAMAELVPARVIIPVHTNEITASLIADALAQQGFSGDKTFLGLKIATEP